MAAKFTIRSLDHIVLTCRSIPKTIDFYTRHLGMKHEVFTSKGVDRYLTHPIPLTTSPFPSLPIVQARPPVWLPKTQPPPIRRGIRTQSFESHARKRGFLSHYGR